MKTETKTSRLAIICALCTLVATPAISAAPVRTLGGTGTYTSASSASASKAATTSTRAGALRVLPTSTKTTNDASKKTTTTTGAAGGTVTATRAATSPRLSIGKYLPHRVVAAPSTDTPSDDDAVVDVVDFESWTGRVSDLEKYVGVVGEGGLREEIDDLTRLVEGLEANSANQEQVENIQTTVVTIEEQITTMQEIVDALPDDVADKTVVDAAISGLDTRVSAIAEKIEKGEVADSETVADLQLSVNALDSAVDTLELSVATLRTDVDNYALVLAGKQDKIIDGEYVYVDGATNQIVLDMTKIKQEIADVTVGEVDISFDKNGNILSWLVDGEVGGMIKFDELYETAGSVDALDTKIEATVGVVKSLAEKNEAAITALQKAVAEHATAIGALETKDLTHDEQIAALEEKTDGLGALAYKDTVDSEIIQENSITAALIADQTITAEKLTTDGLETPLEDGQLAMLVSDGAGGLAWVAYAVE